MEEARWATFDGGLPQGFPHLRWLVRRGKPARARRLLGHVRLQAVHPILSDVALIQALQVFVFANTLHLFVFCKPLEFLVLSQPLKLVVFGNALEFLLFGEATQFLLLPYALHLVHGTVGRLIERPEVGVTRDAGLA
jgi:hypothetical protein